jgi:hypothetical protein
MSNALKTAHIVFDCADAAQLASFWSRLLEVEVDEGANPYFATVGSRGPERLSPAYMFLQVPEERAGKNRLHVDLVGPDLAAQVRRAIDLGARHVGDFDEYGTVWTTLADPEGNLFDVAGDGGA